MKHPDLADIEAAAERLRGRIHETPVMRSRRINDSVAEGAHLFFKCENLQRTGAFKIRGATNAVFSLTPEEAARGVATHSSGNHGAALAAAASDRGISSYIVVPEGAVASKVMAVESYGGQITRCAPTQASRERTLERVLEETGATAVPPYDDLRIVAGQGTAALELIAEVPRIDTLIAPIGGGGLISGCAIAAKALKPDIRVIGAEPSGAADTAMSLAAGEIIDNFTPDTIADGLRAKIGRLNFSIIREYVDEVITVDDDASLQAMRDVWHTMKIIIEPSCSTVLAAARKLGPQLANRRVGVILSGGNVDLDRISFCARCPT
ncbi:MAG: pyridoxal-phosphate dependent enzyme [Pseudomonadota bacterium]